MYNEKANRKACFKEAKKEYARQLKETKQKRTNREVEMAKDRLSSQISLIHKKRDGLILKAVEVDRTDPASAKLIVSSVDFLDQKMKKLRFMLTTCDSKQAISEVNALCAEALEVMRELETQPIDYISGKNRKKIKEDKAIHDIMRKRADEALEDEMSLYTSDILPSDGEGSAAENDFEMAKLKAQIEEIDED